MARRQRRRTLNTLQRRLDNPNLTEERRANIIRRIENLGGRVPNPAVQDNTTQNIQTTNQVLQSAADYGQQMADQYIPAGSFGQIGVATDPRVQQALDLFRGLYEETGQLTPLQQEAVNLYRTSAQGYTPEERARIQENIDINIGRELAGQRRDLAMAQSRGQLGGSSAAAQQANLGNIAQFRRQDLAREMMLNEISEGQRRREGFAGYVQDLEEARMGRRGALGQVYGGATIGEDAARREREAFNVGQRTNEALARSSAAAAGAGIYSGQYSGEQAADIQRQAQERQAQSEDRYFNFARRQAEINQQNQQRLFNQFSSQAGI